ncbi:MAG: D-alanyl-D-alanine carboxypeptidase [Firmicutes bacterium]|nr:D-alanyl-D-alanine carboxypeptidase [Bacillota bacterium]
MGNLRLLSLITMVIIIFVGLSGPVYSLELTSKAGLLMDPVSGRVFLEHNSEEALPVASISKLMTLVLILEALERGEIALTDVVTASPFAASKRGTRIWLEAGEQLTLQELLYAIAVGSANDGAVAVAEYLAGSEPNFVQLMNLRAQELGLEKTVFVNCTGLPEEDQHNMMSAKDVAVLAKHALQVPTLLEYVSTYEYTMRSNTTKIPVLWNANRLLRRYYGVDGLKTGFTTEAGYCLAVTAQRDQLRLLAVTLGHKTDSDRESEARSLLDYGFRKYESLQLYAQNAVVSAYECPTGEPQVIDVVLPQDFYVTVERGRELDLTSIISLEQELSAPLAQGTVVGTITVLYQDQVVGEHPLIINQPVHKANLTTLLLRLSRALAKAIY